MHKLGLYFVPYDLWKNHSNSKAITAIITPKNIGHQYQSELLLSTCHLIDVCFIYKNMADTHYATTEQIYSCLFLDR